MNTSKYVKFQDEDHSLLFLKNRIMHECEAMIALAKRIDELKHLEHAKERT